MKIPHLPSLVRRAVRAVSLLLAGAGLPLAVYSASAGEPLTVDHPQVKAAIAVQTSLTANLMAQPEVLGTAIGANPAGVPALVIYIDSEAKGASQAVGGLGTQVRGVPVQIEITDKFRAYANTSKQSPPIQLGTSGGWSYDLANGYCCGGTLGSLIQVNGVQYILSNYHVLEADIVTGGNGIVAVNGDPIIQPGLIDVNCTSSKAQSVATLVRLGSLPNNNVDCSIAKVVSGMVKPDGSILGIGPLSAQTLNASLNLGVKKSGRTTGLSSSTVNGLNASVKVSYENECAGGTAFTKLYTGQIIIANRGSKFLNAGDSGSLMVENVATKPRAVGLLFAGSNTSAVANPINEVLTFIGGTLGATATMVGN